MDTDIQDMIAGERRELAAFLDELSESQWDAATLCAGWRVREVVAHMTMPFRYSVPRFVREMLTARVNFNRMADRAARRDATELSAAELAASLGATSTTPGNRRAAACRARSPTTSSTAWTSRSHSASTGGSRTSAWMSCSPV